MRSPTLDEIIQRIEAGAATDTDLAALRQILSAEPEALTSLDRYTIGLSAKQMIQVGDRIYPEINDAAIRAIVEAIQQTVKAGMPQIQQSVAGDGNQAIGQNYGTAIGTVQGDVYIDASERKLKPGGIPQNLPRSGAKQFVGRDLDHLHSQLRQADRLAITAIRGMGGIGKTELALQYALYHLRQGTYSGGVCWLRARDQEIATQIVGFARSALGLALPDQLDLTEEMAYCWRHWPEGEVLVVIDDVADYGAIQPYLPPQDPRFWVLLTTRLQLGSSIQPFEITVLDEAAALELLGSLVGSGRIEAELETAKALCEWLGYLPLGLELVGRYLVQKPDLSLEKLQTRLNDQRLAARALSQRQADMTAEHESVAAAIELSWQELTASEQRLAFGLSLFALAPIPWSMVTLLFEDIDEEDLEDDRDQGLVNRSLLQRVEQDTYQLHQLIREFVWAKLELTSQADELKQHFCQQMVQRAQDFPDVPTLKQVLDFAPTVPHLAEAATTLQAWLRDENLIWPFLGLGRFYEGQGAYSQADPWYEACLTATCSRLGNEHPSVASSLNNLALLYLDQGRYGEAEPLFIEALEMTRRLLGNDHPDIATSLLSLALLYLDQGRYGEAEPLFIEALETYKLLLGNDHPNVATSLDSLARLYRAQGRYGEAETLYLEALEMRRRLLGNDHPDVATSLNNLAYLYRAQGRYGEAETLYLEALDLKRHLLGNEHPSVATTLDNLAGLYQDQGRYGEAEPLHMAALELYKRLLGNDHPDVATTLDNLAGLYQAEGRYGEAESLYIEALKMTKRLLGNEHPDVVTSLNNLAYLYESQGRYREAEPLYLEALAIAERQLGSDHPTTQTIRQNYEICQQAMQSADPTED